MLKGPRRYPAIRGGKTNPKEPKYYPPYDGDVENFKIYLNSREYFTVRFPRLERYRWSKSDACDETNNDGIVDDKSFENTVMFKTMAATWVATWLCGISQEDMKRPGVIGSLYRFHVYFTIRRILRSRGRLSFYGKEASVVHNVWKYLPTKYELYDVNTKECVRTCKLIEITNKDFVYMVAPKTEGLTILGKELFQQSVLTYVYALLAAQVVNPGKNIAGTNGIALILQKSFVDKVEDRIRADNGVDNVLDLYERTIAHSTATSTITVHKDITKIPTNLKIVTVSKITVPEFPKKAEVKKPEIIDVRPPKNSLPIVIGVGLVTLLAGKMFL